MTSATESARRDFTKPASETAGDQDTSATSWRASSKGQVISTTTTATVFLWPSQPPRPALSLAVWSPLSVETLGDCAHNCVRERIRASFVPSRGQSASSIDRHTRNTENYRQQGPRCPSHVVGSSSTIGVGTLLVMAEGAASRTSARQPPNLVLP